MSRKYFTLAPTEPEFLTSAPKVYSETMEIPQSAQAVWEELTTDTPFSWCRALSRIQWTSPRPFGVGSTREVRARGGLVYRERFFRWEEGKRQAFCVTEASMPVIRRHAEDYLVEPLGPDRCQFTWTIAVEPSILGRPGRPINALIYKGLFRDARKHFSAS
jgi:hypothetical protein